jgi:hypothetical protein
LPAYPGANAEAFLAPFLDRVSARSTRAGFSGKQMNGRLISVVPDRTDPILRGQLTPAASKIDGKTRHSADPVDREDIVYASQHLSSSSHVQARQANRPVAFAAQPKTQDFNMIVFKLR